LMAPTFPLPLPPKPLDSWLRQHRVQAQQRGRDNVSALPYTQLGPVVRTALTLEARQGSLYLFMPPLNSAEDFVDLVAVIEVNVQPAASWHELAENTTTLYEQARLCRLGTEKFMLDGRHTGTGGGNHIVIGGAAPAGSQLPARPHPVRP